jgi:hypothetical protein
MKTDKYASTCTSRFSLGNYYNYYSALEKQLSSQISRTVITIRALIGRRRLIKNDEPKQMRTVSSPPVNICGGGDGGDCGISRAKDHGSGGVGRRIVTNDVSRLNAG